MDGFINKMPIYITKAKNPLTIYAIFPKLAEQHSF